MKNTHIILAVVILFFGIVASCQREINSNSTQYFKNIHFVQLEPSDSNFHYSIEDFKTYWVADTSDLFIAEKIIFSAIKDLKNKGLILSIKNLPFYGRQYVCFVNSKGERLIWVNALCRILKSQVEINGEYELKKWDWQNKLILVDDGGDCYWRILINIDKETYSDFYINGV